ncbi:glucose-6-phosphate 1-dehydrogenase [Streptomyces sulfonofaciens]|uniref:Glucose-6-phosphate 1-dehydrogenase n=1 Tax=Streptomyces sulfonofaciens TaxID=68272 RepID=A0A919GI46_9ACTN|nr:glucose-6-phosphate dehydrogenase [Streptomyces sulfonofaciens]GHH85073.1 glucose-6-phosphate 1-dehydrogenase [Streptomyces sulfonofaciens]
MGTRADTVVIFGITGDLAFKKLLPALYHLALRGGLGVPVVGVARSRWEDGRLVATARKAVEEVRPDVDEPAFEELAGRLSMVSGDYADEGLYRRLAERLEGAEHPVFYLAVPPAVFGDAVDGLRAAGLADRGRVVVEKPFGYDASSSRALDDKLRSAFPAERILRMDHYLGKEPVEGLLALRFANAFFEPMWNREHIAKVEITLAEKFGTQGRAGFYDAAGAVRDVLQNHALQIAALIAMEPPATAEQVQEARVDALRHMRPLSLDTTVRGQYLGYQDEPGVAPGSTTETYVATRLSVDTARWRGVPFVLRAGKNLRENATDVVIGLRRPTGALFAGADSGSGSPEGNQLHLRLGRDDGLTFSLQVKSPGPDAVSRTVRVPLDLETVLGPRQEAYERLLDDAMRGRSDRFVDPRVIEEQWRIVGPLLDPEQAPLPYEPGGWGPAEAERLGVDAHPERSAP